MFIKIKSPKRNNVKKECHLSLEKNKKPQNKKSKNALYYKRREESLKKETIITRFIELLNSTEEEIDSKFEEIQKECKNIKEYFTENKTNKITHQELKKLIKEKIQSEKIENIKFENFEHLIYGKYNKKTINQFKILREIASEQRLKPYTSNINEKDITLIKPFNEGGFNSTYLVKTNKGNYVFKPNIIPDKKPLAYALNGTDFFNNGLIRKNIAAQKTTELLDKKIKTPKTPSCQI